MVRCGECGLRLGEKVGEDKEADTVAIIRTFIVLQAVICNGLIVWNIIEVVMEEDKYTKLMKLLLIILTPLALGVWLAIGLAELIY